MLSAFRNLSDGDARRASLSSLRELVQGLSHHEYRELCAMIGVHDFRFDILGRFPIEIVLIITQHLDLATIFRCQSISRRWKEVLGSLEIINTTLRPWNRTGECDLVICDKSPTAVANNKSEHVDAFCTGKAFSKMRGCCTCDHVKKWHLPTVAYCNGLVAWLDRTMTCAVVLNLHTGKIRPCSIEGEWMTVALSASLLVCISRADKCCIIRLSDFKSDRTLTIPSTKIARLVTSGGTVAILFKTSKSKESRVIIWNSGSKTETSFIADLGCTSSLNGDKCNQVLIYLIIAPSEQHVIIILCQFQVGEPSTESYTSIRYTLTGTVVSRHTTSYKRSVTGIVNLMSRNPRLCDAVGTYSIIAYTCGTKPQSRKSRWRTSRPPFDRYLMSFIVHVTYSFITDKFSGNVYPVSRVYPSSSLTSPHVPIDLFFYKSIAYGYLRPLDSSIPSFSSTARTLHLFDLNAGTCHPAPMDLIATEGDPDPTGLRVPSHNQNERIMGDEKFVIAFCKDALKAWCFDKNLKMEGEDQIYKDRREGARKWRLWYVRQPAEDDRLGNGEGRKRVRGV